MIDVLAFPVPDWEKGSTVTGDDLSVYLPASTFLSTDHIHSTTMEFDEFKRALKEETGERSELSKGAYETGRRLAHLPD